jgi:UDP:flavonoid glycosyltransferase YjiC (YdhE family)
MRSLEEYVPVPCLSSVRLSDIKIFRAWERPMKIAAELFADVRKAQCVLFTSFHELEPCAIDAIAESLPCPVYPLGPSIPLMLPLNGDNKVHDEEQRKWLDAQPENSVLYVSFGSYLSMPPSQFEEVAMGLRDSGVSFFWVARDKAAGLREKYGGDKGIAVPWCEQQKVLRHPAVGGFLSHCGWNSVLEAVCAGVPLLAFPVAWDQLVNARMAADEWKVGIDLREQRDEDGTVSRAAISAAVRRLMDSDSGAGQEMRSRAAELSHVAHSAVKEGGSSHRSLTGFLEDLLEGKLDAKQTSR